MKLLLDRAVWIFAALSAAGLYAQPGTPIPGPSRSLPLPLSGQTGQAGGVATVQSTAPGGVPSVNTITSTVQVQGAYQGSVPPNLAPGPPLQLSLAEAIRRGLEYNLGNVSFQNIIRQARGQRRTELANLLPNLNGDLLLNEEQTNLAAFGFNFKLPVPGFSIPTIVGPFHYFDLRARVTQSVANLTLLRNYRASRQIERAAELSAQDARDLVVLAVTAGYLQVIATGARVDSARAQVATAQASYQQATDRHNAGVAARIDVTRSQVELQTQQQRLTSVENDLAKQKIVLGRMIGLAPGQDVVLTDAVPYAPVTGLSLDQALLRAAANRPDLKAAQAQVQAAELTHKAALAERYPSVELAADYGALGTSPQNSHGTFAVTGTLRFPIWQGGRVAGDIEQADAALEQRRAEYEDLRGRVDAEVREAYLDLTAAASQVSVAQSNRTLAQDTLNQARDRFAAGVADTLEVVQAQESVAVADQDYIGALYAHNLAKASLARAMGQAEQGIQQLLGRP
ncbi:MAG TPA: TolC family protein [Bryobacteraceae bacterium]|nr:TolC family protein [Bryobacteraceae bacterium]